MDPTIFAKDEYIENQDFGIQVKKEEYIVTKQEDSDPHAFLSSQNNTEASSEHIKRNYIETKVEYEDGQDKARNSCCKKPFKILRNLPSFNKRIDGKSQDFSIKNEFEEDGEEHHEIEKKIVRVSACKNYIGLLCAGFSRTLLNAEKSSPIIETLAQIIDQRKMRFEVCRIMLTEKIMELFKTYIYKSVCGKRVKKCNQERDFKIRNSHELDNILMIKQRDSEQTCLRKEVLKEMLVYFFDSDYYYEWLSKGMISEGNRIFFIKNKKEIQRKFLNPAFYKPKFNHNQEEEGRLSNKED